MLLPRSRREGIAGGVRNQSASAKRNKAESIMDVNAQAIAAAFGAHGVRCIVHGHTHRPADHCEPDGERIVLADWRPGRMEYLVAENGALRREAIS